MDLLLSLIAVGVLLPRAWLCRLVGAESCVEKHLQNYCVFTRSQALCKELYMNYLIESSKQSWSECCYYFHSTDKETEVKKSICPNHSKLIFRPRSIWLGSPCSQQSNPRFDLRGGMFSDFLSTSTNCWVLLWLLSLLSSLNPKDDHSLSHHWSCFKPLKAISFTAISLKSPIASTTP